MYKNKAKLLNQKLSDHVTCSPETAELLASLAECWQNIKVSLQITMDLKNILTGFFSHFNVVMLIGCMVVSSSAIVSN